MRCTGSGMSKWVPCRSLMAFSPSCCIHSRNASLPAILYFGSASSLVDRVVDGSARAGDLRPPPPASRSPAGAARRRPRRRSRRGRPARRGSTGSPARSARGRRPPWAGPSGAISSLRKLPNSAVAVLADSAAAVEPGAQGTFGVDPLGQPAIEVVARGVGPDRTLLRDFDHLLARGDLAPGRLFQQRLLQLSQRCREGLQPGGDVLDRLFALGGHEVEGLPRVVQTAADHVHLARGLTCFVPGDGQLKPFLHRLLGDELPVVDRARSS